MTHLTELESRMLAFIDDYVSTQGKSPTLQDVGNATNVRSLGTVHRYIKSLESKGALVRGGGWRSIRPAIKSTESMNDPQEAFEYAGRMLKATFPEIRLLDTLIGRLTQIDNAMTAIPQDVRDRHTRDMKTIRGQRT